MSETRDYSVLHKDLQPDSWPNHPYVAALADKLVDITVAHDDLRERVEDHGRRLDEFWWRCDRIEERLAAIEGKPVEVAEASAPEKSTDDTPPPPSENILDDLRKMLKRKPLTGEPLPRSGVFPVRDFDKMQADLKRGAKFIIGRLAIEDIIAAIERAATCGIAPNEPRSKLPAQAAVGEAVAVSTEPTPGMVAAANNIAKWQFEAGQEQLKFQTTCEQFIITHIAPELAAKDAEIQRQYAVLAERSEQLATLTRERDEARKNLPDFPDADCTDAAHPAWWRGHDHTANVFCQHVNEILDGKRSAGGIAREPWEATRQRLAGLVQQLAQHREGAEAMEWLEYTHCKLLFGFNCTILKGWFVDGTAAGVYTTPTAAILAAKVTTTTSTGEK